MCFVAFQATRSHEKPRGAISGHCVPLIAGGYMRELSKRGRIINFRVNDSELELIQQRAEQHQTSMSDYARAAALQRRAPREASLVRKELQRLSVLLIHAYKSREQLPDLSVVLQRLATIERMARDVDDHDR